MTIPSFLETLEQGYTPKKSRLAQAVAEPITEATYRVQTISPLLAKLGKVFGKRFGAEFYVLGPEKFKRTDGAKGTGYRMLNALGDQLRINFRGVKTAMSDEFSKDAMYINGIDYWAPDNNNWARATLNITFSRDFNILQIHDRLMALIKAGKKGKFTMADLAGEAVTEAAPTQADRAAFLKSKGLKSSNAYGSKKRFEQYAQEQGVLEEWYALIETGAPEQNSISVSMAEVQKKMDEVQYSDPATVFNDIESLAKFVATSGTAKSLVVCGLGGLGKSLEWGTRVPTLGGYTEIGKLQVGDTVIAANGKPTKVIGKYEHEDKDLYEVKMNDGTSFRCDKDQIFHVEITAHEGSKGIFNMPFVELEQYLRKFPKRYAVIPYCSPIEFEQADLSVDPYLLGLLLGDGCLTQTPALTNVDPAIITGVHKLILEQYENIAMNFDDRSTYRLVGKDGAKNVLKDALKDLGLIGKDSYTKFIPFEYKRASIEQRMELVRGLMDSDGYIMESGHTSYTTCSKQLADDFVEIIRSLGGRARIREKHTKSQFGTPCLSYDVSFKVPSSLGSIAKYSGLKTERYEKVLSKKAWCKKRRIESISAVGKGRTACIAVDDPDALYVIDGFVPVHNTYHVTKALKAFGAQGKDWVYHGAMNVTPNSFFSTVFNERNKVICFDEADAILKDKDIVVMLKPLLDTSGDHRAEWSVQTAPMGLRSEEEIRNYCDNLSQGIATGVIAPTWSRNVSYGERNAEMFTKNGLAAITSDKSSLDDPRISDSIKHILDAPEQVENALTAYLEDEGVKDAAKVVKEVIKTYKKFLDDPSSAAGSSVAGVEARYPSIFFFDGKMIFISNMPAKALDQAVMSRSLFVDVQLRASDIRNRIITILDSDPSYDDVRDVLKAHMMKLDASAEAANQTEAAEYSSPALKRNGKQLTVRYMKLAADMIRSGIPNWEELAAKYC